MSQAITLQTSLFDQTHHPIRIDLPDANLRYWPNFISQDQTQSLTESLLNTLEFQQQLLKVYGKTHSTPRLVAWCADEDVSYEYSNDTLATQAWPFELLALKQRIEQTLDCHFNGALLNYYRDGDDRMGWHSDNEAELGEQPIIASISLGAERTFQLKHIHKSLPRHDILLEDGSLLVMAGTTQQYWQHCLPTRKKIMMPRMNITFRNIIA